MTTAQESMDQKKFFKKVKDLEANIKILLAEIPDGSALSVQIEYVDSEVEEVVELNKAKSKPFSQSRAYAEACEQAMKLFWEGFSQGFNDGMDKCESSDTFNGVIDHIREEIDGVEEKLKSDPDCASLMSQIIDDPLYADQVKARPENAGIKDPTNPATMSDYDILSGKPIFRQVDYKDQRFTHDEFADANPAMSKNELDCTENYVDYSNNDFIGKIGTITNDSVFYAQKYLKRFFPEVEVNGVADYKTYQFFNRWLSAELGVAVKEFYNIDFNADTAHDSLLFYQKTVWIKALSLMLCLKGYSIGEDGISGKMTRDLCSAMNHFLSDRCQLLYGEFPTVDFDGDKRLLSRVELSDLFSGSCLIF